MRVRFLRVCFFLSGLIFWMLCSCTPQDHDHRIVISVADQAMDVYFRNQFLARYQVSTSQFGVGDYPGTCATPLGHLSVAQKIGDGAPLGMVFKDRKPTGEILTPNAPGRDPIVTRILWLKGLEAQNHNAFGRYIYIHGTPVENQIGKPASYGNPESFLGCFHLSLFTSHLLRASSVWPSAGVLLIFGLQCACVLLTGVYSAG